MYGIEGRTRLNYDFSRKHNKELGRRITRCFLYINDRVCKLSGFLVSADTGFYFLETAVNRSDTDIFEKSINEENQ